MEDNNLLQRPVALYLRRDRANSIVWRCFARTFARFNLHPVTAVFRSMSMKNGTKRGRVGAILLTAIFLILASASGMASSVDRERSFCGDCEFQVGMGGTYHSFESTGGEVVPLTMTWDGGRWELGVFHFSEQASADNDDNLEQLVARPYWGASVSRRFKLYERGSLRALFGFGLSYRTETDVLSATHWNFSSQFGLQYQSPEFPATFELSARHWSNGGVRTPSRGQDFTILMIRFDR